MVDDNYEKRKIIKNKNKINILIKFIMVCPAQLDTKHKLYS